MCSTGVSFTLAQEQPAIKEATLENTPQDKPQEQEVKNVSEEETAKNSGNSGTVTGHESSLYENDYILDPVVVIARRYETPLDESSQSISVISNEQIRKANTFSTQELLASAPGVSLSRAGGLGGQVVIRGFSSADSRVAQFVDGDRFRGRSILEYNSMDPYQIERVEIIRGPASVMYGSDAMAGLVNIVTRQAEGDSSGDWRAKGKFRTSYNSANDLTANRAEIETLGHNIDGLLGLSLWEANDYDSPEGKIENSDFSTRAADLRMGYTFNGDDRIEFTGKIAEAEAGRAGGVGGVPGYPLFNFREEPFREKYANLKYTGNKPSSYLDKIEASLYARHLYTEQLSENRTVNNKLTEIDRFVDGPLVLGGHLFTVVPWSENNNLTAGVDFFNEMRDGSEAKTVTTVYNSNGTVKSVKVSPLAQEGPDSQQVSEGVFLLNDWNVDTKWIISAGVRFDYINTSSDTSPVTDEILKKAYERQSEYTETPITESIGVTYKAWDYLHWVANVGKSFRAPTTAESYFGGKFGTGYNVPNPDLEPEEGITYDTGLRLRLPSIKANLTTYLTDYENLISRESITYQGLPSRQYQNVGDAKVYGWEFDTSWAMTDHWTTFANATYTHGNNKTTGAPLSYIPPLNGKVGIEYHKNFYAIQCNWKGSFDKTRIDQSEERKTDGYSIFGVSYKTNLRNISSEFSEVDLTISIENIFNEDYQLPTTYEDISYARSNTNPLIEPGRSFIIGLSWNY